MVEEKQRWWVSKIPGGKNDYGEPLYHADNGYTTNNVGEARRFTFQGAAEGYHGRHHKGGVAVEVEKKEVWVLAPNKDKWWLRMTNVRTGKVIGLCLVEASDGDTVSYSIRSGNLNSEAGLGISGWVAIDGSGSFSMDKQ